MKVIQGIMMVIILSISIWYFGFYLQKDNIDSFSDKIDRSIKSEFEDSRKYYIETIEHDGIIYTVFITKYKSNIFVVKQ